MNNPQTMEQSKIEPDGIGEAVRPRVRSQRRLAGGETFFQPVPAWIRCIAAIGMIGGCFTPNPALTICSLLMLPLLAGLLWFRGEPPVFLFACGIQWLQATTAIFYADFQGMPLAVDSNVGGPKVEEATWLSMAGVLVLAIGMRMALFNRNKKIAGQTQQEAHLLQIDRVFILYLLTFAFSIVITPVAWIVPRLTQPLLTLCMMRWVMVFVLAYTVIITKRQYGVLGLVVAFEILMGFTGFFADFKSVFYILLIILPGAGLVFKGQRLIWFIALTTLVFTLAVFWTAIKPEYREYLNQGSGQQEVTVPVMQRLNELGELTGTLDAAKFNEGFDTLLLRISYVQFFAMTIQNVPSNVPYENGQLWWGSIKQVFMPRLFFPNKPALDDSARTQKYAGANVAGAEQGASIGIGYMGESYIDFGPAYMFFPILILGAFYGALYRFISSRSSSRIFGLATGTIVVFPAIDAFESSNVKLVGGTVLTLLTMYAFNYIAAARLLTWLKHPMVKRRQIRAVKL
jgi:hypothetical protein